MAYNDPEALQNPAETMRKVMEEIGDHTPIETPTSLDLTQSHFLAVPKHREVKDLTGEIRALSEYLKPARRKGTATLESLQSLIDWSNRFKGDSSVLFAKADMAKPQLSCVADYHLPGPINPLDKTGDPTARHGHHKANYSFPLSDEWKAWMGISGRPQEKDDMGEFIEIHATEILDPTPAIIEGKTSEKNQGWENRLIETACKIEGRFGQLHQLLQMSRQFQVFETNDLKVSTNRDTGEAEIKFVNEHKDAEGAPLQIPNLIIIAIPVFRGGAPYRMAVRFRYSKNGASLRFILSVFNPEKYFQAAFEEAVEQARKETDLPLLFGTPETA